MQRLVIATPIHIVATLNAGANDKGTGAGITYE